MAVFPHFTQFLLYKYYILLILDQINAYNSDDSRWDYI